MAALVWFVEAAVRGATSGARQSVAAATAAAIRTAYELAVQEPGLTADEHAEVRRRRSMIMPVIRARVVAGARGSKDGLSGGQKVARNFAEHNCFGEGAKALLGTRRELKARSAAAHGNKKIGTLGGLESELPSDVDVEALACQAVRGNFTSTSDSSHANSFHEQESGSDVCVRDTEPPHEGEECSAELACIFDIGDGIHASTQTDLVAGAAGVCDVPHVEQALLHHVDVPVVPHGSPAYEGSFVALEQQVLPASEVSGDLCLTTAVEIVKQNFETVDGLMATVHATTAPQLNVDGSSVGSSAGGQAAAKDSTATCGDPLPTEATQTGGRHEPLLCRRCNVDGYTVAEWERANSRRRPQQPTCRGCKQKTR